MKTRIGLDMDGTICNTAELIIQKLIASGKLQPSITADDAHWHYLEWDPVKKTGFRGLRKQDIDNLFVDPQFWADIEIYDGVKEIIHNLSKSHEIYVVTARKWNWGTKEATIDWLNKYDIPYTKLISCSAMKKDEIASLYNFAYFIEDYADATSNIVNQVDKVFLINRPWNKNFTTADKCVRIDWEDIADLPNGDLSEFAGRELAHVKCGEKT